MSPASAGVVHWRQSLRTRIALWSALINIVLLLALAVATAWFARRVIFADARRDTIASAQEAATDWMARCARWPSPPAVSRTWSPIPSWTRRN